MKFIEFADSIINTKYLGRIIKVKGINDYAGKYGITLVLDGFENITEWYNKETERNSRFIEIKNSLLQYNPFLTCN